MSRTTAAVGVPSAVSGLSGGGLAPTDAGKEEVIQFTVRRTASVHVLMGSPSLAYSLHALMRQPAH